MLSWVSVDLRAGHILAELPDLECDTVSSIIGRPTTTGASLPLPGAPVEWERATLHGASAFILLDDDETTGESRPLWGGEVTHRTRSLGDKVELTLATLEAYLDGRFVGDWTYTATGQNLIVADLISRFVNDGTINIRVQYDGPGALRDRTYTDAEDKSVYEALTELMGLGGGPEWTIGWERQHSPERITPVLYVGGAGGSPRIGSSPIAGLGPAATFESGSISEATFDEDYGKGKGASEVLATSSGVGAARPQSAPQVAPSPDRPTFEHRFQPTSNVTDTATLTAHAQARLGIMAEGARAVTLTAIVESAPRLGRDWFIGDDIGYSIGGTVYDTTPTFVTDGFFDEFEDPFLSVGTIDVETPRETVPAFPGGFSGVARNIGWELSLSEPQKVKPILGVDA